MISPRQRIAIDPHSIQSEASLREIQLRYIHASHHFRFRARSMNRLHIPPAPGRVAWTYDHEEFSLPGGLKNGDQVVIVDRHLHGSILIRDAHGQTHTIHRALLDCGFEFEVGPNDWRHESDPEVISRLRETIARLRADGAAIEADPASIDEQIAHITKILSRHGAA
jgi:hypothetical protein